MTMMVGSSNVRSSECSLYISIQMHLRALENGLNLDNYQRWNYQDTLDEIRSDICFFPVVLPTPNIL